MKKFNEFMKAHIREVGFVVLAIITYNLLPLDESWSLIWLVVGIISLKQSISMIDRYWSRKGKNVSLTLFMSQAKDEHKLVIYCSLIIAFSLIIASAISGI